MHLKSPYNYVLWPKGDEKMRKGEKVAVHIMEGNLWLYLGCFNGHKISQQCLHPCEMWVNVDLCYLFVAAE